MTKELVATVPSRIDALGAEGAANAFLGEWRGIHRVVQKPRSVVIPEVVVGIRFTDAKRGEGDEVRGHDA